MKREKDPRWMPFISSLFIYFYSLHSVFFSLSGSVALSGSLFHLDQEREFDWTPIVITAGRWVKQSGDTLSCVRNFLSLHLPVIWNDWIALLFWSSTVTHMSDACLCFYCCLHESDPLLSLTSHQGLQWSLLKDEEVIPHILAMEGRRVCPPGSERQQRGGGEFSGSRRRKGRPPNLGESDFPNPSEAKLLRKLEAQGTVHTFIWNAGNNSPTSIRFFVTPLKREFTEWMAEYWQLCFCFFVAEIARQAAQMKLMRKLEKQALARAAKEARKQQGTPHTHTQRPHRSLIHTSLKHLHVSYSHHGCRRETET